MVFLILPSSFFAGFKSCILGLLWKLGLWSIKQFCLPFTNILFITFLFFIIFFSLVVDLVSLFLANLFVRCSLGTLLALEVSFANVKVVLVFFTVLISSANCCWKIFFLAWNLLIFSKLVNHSQSWSSL